jgi:hypothetical protein
MAQFGAMLQERGLIEVYADEQGREAYTPHRGEVRGREHARHGRGQDADAVMEALLQGGADEL